MDGYFSFESCSQVPKKSDADAALTRAIDAIEFKETVHVGDWVNFEANIISTGNSSIVINIDAYKESKK